MTPDPRHRWSRRVLATCASIALLPAALLLVSSNSAASPPHADAAELTSTLFNIELWDRGEIVAPGGQIGLCQQACIGSTGDIDESLTGSDGHLAKITAAKIKGDLSIPQVPTGRYKVAVVVDGLARGYVAGSRKKRLVVGSFAEGRYFDAGQSYYWEFSFGSEPVYPTATFGIKAPMWGNEFSYFKYKVTKAERRTSVRSQVIGCGGRVVATKTRTGKGRFSFKVRPKPKLMGKRWKVRTSISAPGKETYVVKQTNWIGRRYFPACRGS